MKTAADYDKLTVPQLQEEISKRESIADKASGLKKDELIALLMEDDQQVEDLRIKAEEEEKRRKEEAERAKATAPSVSRGKTVELVNKCAAPDLAVKSVMSKLEQREASIAAAMKLVKKPHEPESYELITVGKTQAVVHGSKSGHFKVSL